MVNIVSGIKSMPKLFRFLNASPSVPHIETGSKTLTTPIFEKRLSKIQTPNTLSLKLKYLYSKIKGMFKTKHIDNDKQKKYELVEILCFGKDGKTYTKLKRRKIKRNIQLEPRKYALKKDKSRYLYHITTKKNYERIQQSGGLIAKTGEDTIGKPQVFLFNLENLLNAWNRKIPMSRTRLQQLLQTVAKDDTELVMLRVDTKALNKERLKIRPLDKLFETYHNNDKSNEFLFGEDNGLSYIYKQRKTPYEYLYSNDIPLSSISVVGNASYIQTGSPLFNMLKNNEEDIMRTLLQDSKEKGFSFLI